VSSSLRFEKRFWCRYLGPPEKDAVVAAQQRWLIASL
jgi:hypothetical protein